VHRNHTPHFEVNLSLTIQGHLVLCFLHENAIPYQIIMRRTLRRIHHI
jgi:hypothetical protein